MKVRIFVVSILAVVLFCFVFSSSIADDYDLMYYWNSNPRYDDDWIDVHDNTSDDLYWYIKNTLDRDGDAWQFCVELRVTLDEEIVFSHQVCRTPGSSNPREEYGTEYDLGDLFGAHVELFFLREGDLLPTSGVGYGFITYPY